MKKTIPNNFSGVLNLQSDNANEFDCHFSINNHTVTVLPFTGEARKYAYDNLSDDFDKNGKWIYGLSEDGSDVAFLSKARLDVGFPSPSDLSPVYFNASMIIKSSVSQPVNLRFFNMIEFHGGIIDLLFPASRSFEYDNNTKSLKFLSKEEYTNVYDVDLNGEVFKLVISINAPILIETGKVPDLRNHVHSIIQFVFEESKPLADLEKYYSYVMSLSQFCVGQMDTNFDIRLYQNDILNDKIVTNFSPAYAKYHDGFDDYALEMLDITKVLRLDILGGKLPSLFKILVEDDSKPHLSFLPRRNRDIGIITYFDIVDICVSFENEYSFQKDIQNTINPDILNDAKSLHTDLKKLIESSSCHIDVKNKAKQLLGNLQKFNPNIEERVCSLYSRYETELKTISEIPNHDKLGIARFYTTEEFKVAIKKFVGMRGKATHTEIIWNEGVAIYDHLKLLLYFCVLFRAGYTNNESAAILSWLFQRKF